MNEEKSASELRRESARLAAEADEIQIDKIASPPREKLRGPIGKLTAEECATSTWRSCAIWISAATASNS